MDPQVGQGIGFPTDFVSLLDGDALQGARIGVLRSVSNTPNADPEIGGLFNASLALMASKGVVSNSIH
jgi:hypothetical protein